MGKPHNIGRFEAFSDAVFTFAATLMVMNFDMADTLAITKSNATSFLSFFVSFFVLVALISVILALSGAGLKFRFPGFIYRLIGPFCYWHSENFTKTYEFI